MERRNIRSALLIAAVAVSILVAIVLCYYLLNTPEEPSHIELPDYTVIPSDEPPREEPLPFATVTVDNVAQVLQNVTPLDACHRVLTLEYYWSDGSAEQSAEVWSRDGETRLVISDASGEKRHILVRTDGAWLWYEGEEPVEIPAGTMSVDDLIGIPDYAAMNESAEVLDAGYATLAGNDGESCIYAKWQAAEGYTAACWVDPMTGLLARAVVEENGVMIYRMQQQQAERLLPGDEAYHTPFLLPGEDS